MSVVKGLLVAAIILTNFYGVSRGSSFPYHHLDDEGLSMAKKCLSLPTAAERISERLAGFSPDIKSNLSEHCARKVFLVWADIAETFSSKEWQDIIEVQLGLKAKGSFKVEGVIKKSEDNKALYCIY